MTAQRQTRPAFATSVAAASGGAVSRLCGAPVCRAPVAAVPQARRAAAARTPTCTVEPYTTDKNKFAIGFTSYAEKLNGRAAMIGFMIALGFELFLPDQGGLVAVFLDLIGKSAS
jgi:hypothetical protein